MVRLIVSMKIALISLLFVLGSNAMAFTFRLAPDDGTTYASDTHAQVAPAIPTPQFFRLLLRQGIWTFVLEEPFGRPSLTASLPEVPIHTPQPASSPAEPPSDQRRNLSGVEALLLRHPQTLVDQMTP